ncbi:MAG: DEAD/DEAH box helicase, partial [Rickettsiales bacterium]|nr:DEAD/DEAH box helicase [Rickettsiales bacterium]
MTYELLDEKMRRAIYWMGWTHFKSIQDRAIEYLIKSPGDLIISAPTASGKTEACFLPIISNIIKTAVRGVKILYISPLKALINDQ